MVLKSQVEWALHCCAILAAVPPGHYLPTKDLAELHGVPKEYLSKAMQALSLAGIVESTLGPNGGYRLARVPHDITFLDIIEAIEGDRSMFVCTEIRKNNPCRTKKNRDMGPCTIARVMYGADEAWRSHLRNTRLSDLLETLQTEVSAELLQKTADWVIKRS